MDQEKILDLEDFKYARTRLNRLINNWDDEIEKTELRRSIRHVFVDIDEMHESGKLAECDTLIPIRCIDENINREKPVYIRYITESRRLVIVKDNQRNEVNQEPLENDFTDGIKHPGLNTSLFKAQDGSSTHGWDAIELEWDKDAKFNLKLSHIGRDNLIIPKEVEDIDSCEVFAIRHECTLQKLMDFAEEYDFDKGQLEKIKQKQSESQREDEENLCIYKVYMKKDGHVKVAWHSQEADNGWLKEPEGLFLGRKFSSEEVLDPVGEIDPFTGEESTEENEPVEEILGELEEQYPVFILPYNITEMGKLMDQKGRVFLDKEKQEALTALWSAYINQGIRASYPYASPENSSQEGGPIKALDLDLEPDRLYNQKLEFWTQPKPDPDMVRVAKELDIRQQQETGQVAFAVSNRKDSRKTAKELDVAQQQESLTNTVQVVLFSIFMQTWLDRVFRIVYSRVKHGELHSAFSPAGLKLMQELSPDYVIRPAGDVDVIKRLETLAKMKQLWPIVSNTPAAPTFLADILRMELPETADKYIAEMQKGNQKNQMIDGLLSVIQEMVADDNGAIKPEFEEKQNMLAQLSKAAQNTKQNNLVL